MPYRHIPATCILMLVAACGDLTEADSSLADAHLRAQLDGSPVVDGGAIARSDDPRYGFERISDDSLWSRISASGGHAVLGFKRPAEARGIRQGRVTVPPSELAEFTATVSQREQIEILSKHEYLPAVRLRIGTKEEMRWLRTADFKDYLEPTTSPYVTFNDPGCARSSYDGPTAPTPSGDVMSDLFKRMEIDRAWSRSNGAGVTIGLTDTGVYASSDQMVTRFASGLNRSAQYLYTLNYTTGLITDDGCSHGTRLGSVAAGPRDGSGPIGVGWAANLTSVRFNDDVVNWDSYYAAAAISKAASSSHITIISWGTLWDWFSIVESEIEFWYYNGGRMFVGAAGTSGSCASVHDIYEGYVHFPAKMWEVLAVTTVDRQGYIACDAHYGYDNGYGVKLTTFYDYPSSGPGTQVYSVRGSSSAAAVVAGSAALVWSFFGTNRDDVVNRLTESASNYPTPDSKAGFGIINVTKALGGMYGANLNGCTSAHCEFLYKLASCKTVDFSVSPIGGDGPFSYRWSTGATGTSTSMYVCPVAGEISEYPLSVTVTDLDPLAENILYKSATIQVISSNPDDACPTCPQ